MSIRAQNRNQKQLTSLSRGFFFLSFFFIMKNTRVRWRGASPFAGGVGDEWPDRAVRVQLRVQRAVCADARDEREGRGRGMRRVRGLVLQRGVQRRLVASVHQLPPQHLRWRRRRRRRERGGGGGGGDRVETHEAGVTTPMADGGGREGVAAASASRSRERVCVSVIRNTLCIFHWQNVQSIISRSYHL